MASSTVSPGDLLQSAHDDQVLGDDAMSAFQVIDLGDKIGDALGVSADEFSHGEVILVGVMVDDSGSIRFASNTQAVADGHNRIRNALADSKQLDNILFHTRLLNGAIINPFVSVDKAVDLQTGPGGNYNPNQGTPLYDESVAFWGTIIAKCQEFLDRGVACRTISLIITDGSDQHSQNFYEMRQDPNSAYGQWRAPKDKVAALAKDMLAQENHIVAAMGVLDPDAPAPFKQIFSAMGLRDEWILPTAADEHQIRQLCDVFSQSAVKASQTAAGFSHQAVGGFTN